MPFLKFEGSMIDLSPNVFLNKFSEGEPNVRTPRNLLTISNLDNSLFECNQWYIAFREPGYFSGTLDDFSFLASLSKLKIMVYLGLLYRVFCERDPRPWSSALGSIGYDYHPESLKAVVVDVAVPSNVHSVALPRQISKLLSHICLDSDNNKYIDFQQSEHPDICNYVKMMLNIPAKLSANNFDSDDIVSIKTAIEWGFEAKTNENETVSFIQTCIALEAILGDDANKDALSATLADRCAYLISPRIADRSKIKADFRKIYDVRSKLVHGRRIRLSHDERHSLLKAKDLLNSVIRNEIGNVKFTKA